MRTDTVAKNGTGASLTDRLAEFFTRRPGVWIDGRALATVAGSYAWRTRISDLRRPPFGMVIQNRQRHVRAEGRRFVVSEYCFLPKDVAA